MAAAKTYVDVPRFAVAQIDAQHKSRVVDLMTRTATAGALAALATLPTWVEGQAPAQQQGIDSNAAWLRGITAKNKQFFETGKAENAIPFLHVVNYFGAWRATPGVAQNDVMAVIEK